MHSAYGAVYIRRSEDDVFALLEDANRYPEWIPGLIEVEVAGSGLGSTTRWVHQGRDRPLRGVSRCEVFQPPWRLVNFSEGMCSATWQFRLGAVQDATLLELSVQYEVPAPLRETLADSTIHDRGQRFVEEALESVRSLLEVSRHTYGR